MSFYFTSGLLASDELATYECGPDSPRIGYDTKVTSDTITADYEDSDHPLTNILDTNTFEYWKSTSYGTQYLTITLPVHTGIDYLAVSGHNFRSALVRFTLQMRANTSASWADVYPEITKFTGDEPLIIHFENTYNRYFRVKVYSTASTFPKITNLLLGKILTIPRHLYVGHSPLSHGRDIVMSRAESESGEFMGTVVRRRMLDGDAGLKNIPEKFFRSHIVPFINSAESRAFVWAWRPHKYPTEVNYAWLTQMPKPTIQHGQAVDLTLQMRAKWFNAGAYTRDNGGTPNLQCCTPDPNLFVCYSDYVLEDHWIPSNYTFNSGRWVGIAAGGGDLLTDGTWADGYRPAYAIIDLYMPSTDTGVYPVAIDVVIRDTDNAIIAAGVAVMPENFAIIQVEVALEFGDYDIGRISIDSPSYYATPTIACINFTT